jgi:hypothetical protein
MKYLNLRTSYGVETVDQLVPADFPDRKAFRAELRRLVAEYHLGGMAVYVSRRPCRDWL